jgi:hypothetical protein
VDYSKFLSVRRRLLVLNLEAKMSFEASWYVPTPDDELESRMQAELREKETLYEYYVSGADLCHQSVERHVDGVRALYGIHVSNEVQREFETLLSDRRGASYTGLILALKENYSFAEEGRFCLLDWAGINLNICLEICEFESSGITACWGRNDDDDERACDELRYFILLVHGEYIERAFGALYEAAVNLHGNNGLQTAIAILSGFYGEFTCWQKSANLLRNRAAAAASPVNWDEVRKMQQ